MSDLPFTRNRTSAERDADIRSRVRNTTALPSTAAASRLARPGDAPHLLELFAFPEVNRWIYSLPRPLNEDGVRAYIEEKTAAKDRGEAILSLNFDETGTLSGFSEVHVWPEWAAGEVAGGMRPDLQNKGQGGAGMIGTFTWMFDALDLDLLCNTTATDNVRIQKLFEKTGFAYRGDILSRRPDGSSRASQVWEITREDWTERLAQSSISRPSASRTSGPLTRARPSPKGPSRS